MRPGAALALLLCIGACDAAYLGKELGALSRLHHGVRGVAYAVDSRTLYLHDFAYDGVGPAAYFYVGSSKTISAEGALRLRDERGSPSPLRKYRGEGVTLSLPDGKTLKDFTWFAVWCDDYAVNFGSVEIPRGLEYPRPAKLSALRGVHAVTSDPVVVVDAQTLLVPNFSYDGEAPDAKFWVGRGDQPSPQGIRIPDENGKETPLRRYDKKTIVLTLPGELTVFDIGHFAVWCEAFTVNFGHVVLPRAALANVPPSLKMLGVSPQSRNSALSGGTTKAPPRSRKPHARLDATTYRPPRLGAGPPATAEQPAEHTHQRRDYQLSAPHQLTQYPHDTKEMYEIKDYTGHQQNQNNQDDTRYKSNQYQNEQRQYENQFHHLSQVLDSETRALLQQQRLYEEQRAALQRQLDQYGGLPFLIPYSQSQNQRGLDPYLLRQ